MTGNIEEGGRKSASQWQGGGGGRTLLFIKSHGS